MIQKVILVLILIGSLYASIEAEVDAKRFEHKNGTLIDHFSGMQWQDDKDTKTIERNWQDAKDYCSNLVLDRKNDWRLPNIVELQFAYQEQKKFENITLNENGLYWCIGNPNNPRDAHFIAFANGYSSDSDLYWNNQHYIRCIRGKMFMTTFQLNNNIMKNKRKFIYTSYDVIYKNIFRNTKKEYNLKEFIKRYPKAPQVQDALKYLASLEYKSVQNKNNISGYEWFIKTYPKAPQVKEAIAKIHQLAFDEAKDIDTISAYNTFIISYPMA